jgi:predicted Zn-dependent protease
MKLTRIAAAATLLTLVACSTNPVTDRAQLMVISEEQILTGSYSAYADMLDEAALRRALNTDARMTERVRAIAARIIPQAVAYRPKLADWQWEVNVIKSDVSNAFCMPGGKIAVNAALLTRLQPTEDELAQIIGHEIAHALSEHSREKISNATASGYLLNVIGLSPRMNTVSSKVLQNIVEIGIHLPNGRFAEREADQIGTLIAAKAGYDPRAAISLWEKVRALQDDQAERASTLLSTHPLPAERIAALQEDVARLSPIYHAAAERRKATLTPPAD